MSQFLDSCILSNIFAQLLKEWFLDQLGLTGPIRFNRGSYEVYFDPDYLNLNVGSNKRAK